MERIKGFCRRDVIEGRKTNKLKELKGEGLNGRAQERMHVVDRAGLGNGWQSFVFCFMLALSCRLFIDLVFTVSSYDRVPKLRKRQAQEGTVLHCQIMCAFGS